VTELEYLRKENAYLKQELAELRRLIFGKKSERFVPAENPEQQSLFGQEVSVADKEEVETSERKATQVKKKPIRQELPAHLPRVERTLEPEGVDLSIARKMGEEITEFLNYHPSKIFVERIVRPKYKLVDESIIIAPLKDAQPIAKSNIGAEMLSHLIISKYVDHLPLYRQIRIFKRQGVDIAESTMNNWVQSGMKLLQPLFDHVQNHIKQSRYLQADETPIAVLESLKPGSTHKGYYWVYHIPGQKLISFQYHKSRAGDAAREHLKEFEGYLQTDGYAGYNQFKQHPKIRILACMAHARRKFHNAIDNDQEKANQALALFGKLYDVERQARDESMTHEQRLALRKENSAPIMKELENWLADNQNQVLPKSALGEAIAYTKSLWARLNVFLEDGILEIDNNLIENKIRPIALGRKNYLFAGSHEAATRAGMLYSFMAMCQMENVNPQEWLTYVLKRINDHCIQNLDELLPANWEK
jgi:transposase